MRNDLSKFIGENNQAWIGTFSRTSQLEEWVGCDVILVNRYVIKDIYTQDGEYISDHIWISVEQVAGNEIMSSLKEGDKIYFNGRVSTYYKASKDTTANLQKDYCIVDIHNIVPFEDGLINRNYLEQTIIDLKLAGYSTENIALLVGKAKKFVYDILHENELLNKNVAKVDDTLRNTIINLDMLGYSHKEISELSGMPLSEVKEYFIK